MFVEGIIFLVLLATATNGLEKTIDGDKKDGKESRQMNDMNNTEKIAKIEYRRLHQSMATKNGHVMF